MAKKILVPQPSLWKINNAAPRIGILQMGDNYRSSGYTFGLDAVVDELSINTVGRVTPETVNDVDIALASFTSPMDILSFVSQFDERPKSKLIIGGQGVYSFLGWRHLASKIMFGRAEGVVDKIILGDEQLPYIYQHDIDPFVEHVYEIRQAKKFLQGESAVGCAGHCKFCQYSATRSLFGRDYSATSRGNNVVEDRWNAIKPKTGNQTTALDGWSEKTRRLVNKPVTDEQIVNMLSKILREIRGVMRLKVFQIVGYPWETAESIQDDILHFRDLLGKVKPGHNGGRIMMMITTTPFSPEPLTEFENESANITTNWREIMLNDSFRCIFDSYYLNAFFLPQIPGGLLLYKRVVANRSDNIDVLRGVAKSKTLDEALKIGGDLHLAGAGVRVSRVLKKESAPNNRSQPTRGILSPDGDYLTPDGNTAIEGFTPPTPCG